MGTGKLSIGPATSGPAIICNQGLKRMNKEDGKEQETVESLRLKNELLQQVIEKKAEEMAKLELKVSELTKQIQDLRELIV